MNITNTMGALPSWNGRVTGYGDSARTWREHVYDHICQQPHLPVRWLQEEVEGLRMEASVRWPGAGRQPGHHDINAVVKMIDQCNDYGMDTIELATPSRPMESPSISTAIRR
jgi:hypothetical protein